MTVTKHRGVYVVILWAAFVSAYLLFAGEFSPEELIVGGSAAAVATGWSVAIRRNTSSNFEIDRNLLRDLLRAIVGVPAAVARVAWILARALPVETHGDVVTRRFVHGARQDPAARTRRAMTTLAVSLAPDSFVVRLPEGRDQLVIHRLTASSTANETP